MYHIYSTEGIIFDSKASKEADRVYSILTKDMGLIFAEARGVRKLDSKLRYALQDFFLVQLALVRGKEKWRIANAIYERDLFAGLRTQKEAVSLVGRIVALLKRLLPSEGKDSAVFDVFLNGLVYLSEAKPSGKELQNIECVLVLRILKELGYLGDLSDLAFFVQSSVFDTHLVFEMGRFKNQALLEINKSLRATNL